MAAEGAAAKRERSAEVARENSGAGETLRPLASMKKKTNEPSTESIQAELADLLASGGHYYYYTTCPHTNTKYYTMCPHTAVYVLLPLHMRQQPETSPTQELFAFSFAF